MPPSHGKPKPNSTRAAADDKPPQDSAQFKAAAPSSPLSWLLAAGVGAATVIYLLVFLGEDLLPQADRSYPRFLLFTNLLTPDDVAKEWVEGNWGNFMVLDRWRIALCAVGLLLYLSFPVGSALMRWRFDLTRLERAVFAQGIGLQLISLLILSFGLFIGFHGSFILLIFFSPIIFLATAWRYSRESPENLDAAILGEEKQKPDVSPSLSTATWALRIVLVLLTLAILLGAMLPPWDFDVREYHLQVPKEWIAQGRVTFLPHNVYGNMPLGAEMHSILASPILASLTLGGLTGKTVMACFGPLTGLAIYAAGRRHFSKLAGLSAAAVYLSCPWVDMFA